MATSKKSTKNAKEKKLSYEWRRVAYFFKIFSVQSSTEHLWEMLRLALTSEDEPGDLKERSDRLFFYEYTKELIENINIILKAELKANSKKP